MPAGAPAVSAALTTARATSRTPGQLKAPATARSPSTPAAANSSQDSTVSVLLRSSHRPTGVATRTSAAVAAEIITPPSR